MKLSTRARYGTRALVELALHWGEGAVLLRDIASRQNIPLPYLEHLISPLVQAGIVKSTRGARGGLSLAKSPEEITLSEVIPLLEGSIDLLDCVNNPESCPYSDTCVTRRIWVELKESMDKTLQSVTLQDLVTQENGNQSTRR
ncbi:MAG: RrF2 family transcriptional regulator [Dehalococcoidia bacterium]